MVNVIVLLGMHTESFVTEWSKVAVSVPPCTVTVCSLVSDSAESSISTVTSILGSVSPPPVPAIRTVIVIVGSSLSLTLDADAEMDAVGVSTNSSSLTVTRASDGVPGE